MGRVGGGAKRGAAVESNTRKHTIAVRGPEVLTPLESGTVRVECPDMSSSTPLRLHPTAGGTPTPR
ncbi:hypothetical protein CcI6DRAFT_01214 [Frankia sp. CcI6]|nr:hypothetical protein CcI6DRAFT_01214 [Frankia sp. CcI6]